MTRLPENRNPSFSLKKVISKAVSPIVWFFNAIGEARLDKARLEAAIVIQREYPQETVGYVFNLLKYGDIGELTLKGKSQTK